MADIASSLTLGERLLIARRRAGISQAEMAAVHGLTRTVYGRIERDQMDGSGTKAFALGRIEPHEIAMILRRRAGATQKEVAEEIGLSRHWVSKMETGQVPCDRLIGGVNV